MSDLSDIIDGPGWSLTVDAESDGERLDRFIARRLPRVSRSRAARLAVYRVGEDDKLIHPQLKKSARVREGQRLWAERPVPSEDISTLTAPRILTCDADLTMLDKPAGWVAHPTASRYRSALTTWLKQRELNVTPVHRLDAETSGLTLCAAPSTEAEARALFLQRAVQKRYLAVCEVTERGLRHLQAVGGLSSGGLWRDQTPLGFDPRSEVKIKMGRGDLQAETSFRVRRVSQGGQRALIEARPITGRQHQIRAHLSLTGLPLVGDKLYGPSESIFLRSLDGALTDSDYAALGHYRQALHATALTIDWRGSPLAWESPLPRELDALLESALSEAPCDDSV